jgi:cyclophilin family peptidyl-prolyl cis-trans isomerase
MHSSTSDSWRLHSLFLITIFLWISCLPPKKDKTPEGSVSFEADFNDVTNRLVYNWQDRMLNDSLLPYFKNSSASKRLIAVLAFGSHPDSNAISALAEALQDQNLSVRVAAAYALGQTRHIDAEKYLLRAWVDNDVTPGYAILNSMILESTGKTGSAGSLKHMVEMSKLIPSDTLMLIGQARGIFQFMLRGIVSEAGTQLMVERIEDKAIPEKVKLIASQYLSRVGYAATEPFTSRLEQEFRKDYSVYIKANLIHAIGQGTDKSTLYLLKSTARDTSIDYRIRVQAVKGLTKNPNEETEQLMDRLLLDTDHHVQQIAGSYFVANGVSSRAMYYFNRATQLAESDFKAKYQLIKASLKFMPNYQKDQQDSIADYLKNELKKTTNIAISASMIECLAYHYNSMVFLKDLMYSNQPIAIRSAAAATLGNMAARKSFDAHFASYAPESKTYIAKYLSIAASQASNPLLAPSVQALIDAGPGLRLYIPDSIDFNKTLDSLTLPRQAEEYTLLSQLITLIYPDLPAKPAFKSPMNNPIDWDIFAAIPDSAVAEVQTNRGKIDILLYKNQTPATVCQFVRLAREGYYRNKIFHRVEPYFVIQGGCNRGDGYGSLDATLRSETPPIHYEEEGMVGMASVGRHTESQQFFITHGPAMHLDGQYTLFGKVIKGMDIVHQIKAGDVIEAINIR